MKTVIRVYDTTMGYGTVTQLGVKWDDSPNHGEIIFIPAGGEPDMKVTVTEWVRGSGPWWIAELDDQVMAVAFEDGDWKLYKGSERVAAGHEHSLDKAQNRIMRLLAARILGR